MKTIAVALLAGSALAAFAGAARAQGIYSLEVHDGDNAGTAYAFEEAYRNNNEQLGAGMEHARCNVLRNAPGATPSASPPRDWPTTRRGQSPRRLGERCAHRNFEGALRLGG